MSKKKNSGLTRRASGLLALEQRFMFDGAAVDTGLDIAKSGDGQLHFIADAHALPGPVLAAYQAAEKAVNDFFKLPDARAQLFALMSGGKSSASEQWNAAFDQLLANLTQGSDQIKIELRSSSELQNSLGAFSATGTHGEPVIYINRDWIASSMTSSEPIVRVLVEEIGHGIDYFLNGAADTSGDEGQAFALHVLPNAALIANDTAADDHLLLNIDGVDVSAEAAGSSFDAQGNALSFSSSTLKSGSGTAAGTIYVYSNVITIDSQQIDAVIELTALSNATLSSFDSTSNPYADSTYFQPNLTIGSVGGYATFSISFILGGTYVNTSSRGTATTLQHVFVNTYDLDGSGAAANGRQFTDFQDIGSYTLNSGSSVTVQSLGSGITRFVTTVGGNITSAPGTTGGDNIRARIQYDNVSTTTVKIGDAGATGLAYFGIDFSQGVAYSSPVVTDSTPPTVAITSDVAALKAGETALLTFTFSEDVGTSFVSGDISVSGGTLGTLTKIDATHYTTTFTPDANSTTNGVVSVANTKFTDAAGNQNADGADSNNTLTLTVDTVPALTVSSVTVNEGSPYAVFTLSGAANQQATLGLSGQNADGVSLSTVQYFDGTAWHAYTGGSVTLNGSGSLLVRVALSPEQETALDGPETFNLVATNTSGTAATGVGMIVDDGTGSYFTSENNTGTSSVPSGVTLDDDRPPAPTPSPPAPPARLALPPVVPADPPQPSAPTVPTQVVQTLPVDAPLVLNATLTSASGHQIAVSETARPGLSLYQGVTDQFIQSTSVATKVSMPFDAFIHTNKDAVIKLNAKQADDSPLPKWVQFDPTSGTFEVAPPKGFKGKLDLKVIARDDDGREAVALFQMFIGEQQIPERPQSRESFSEKLRLAGRRSIVLERVAELKPHKVVILDPKAASVRGG